VAEINAMTKTDDRPNFGSASAASSDGIQVSMQSAIIDSVNARSGWRPRRRRWLYLRLFFQHPFLSLL